MNSENRGVRGYRLTERELKIRNEMRINDNVVFIDDNEFVGGIVKVMGVTACKVRVDDGVRIDTVGVRYKYIKEILK